MNGLRSTTKRGIFHSQFSGHSIKTTLTRQTKDQSCVNLWPREQRFELTGEGESANCVVRSNKAGDYSMRLKRNQQDAHHVIVQLSRIKVPFYTSTEHVILPMMSYLLTSTEHVILPMMSYLLTSTEHVILPIMSYLPTSITTIRGIEFTQIQMQEQPQIKGA